MNLHTLDTTVGAGTISSRDGLCEFVKQVVEFNVKGQAYCCKDPFGKERYGNDPDLPRPCKVSYEKANITVVTLNLIVDADNPKYVESCVGEMRDDIKAALWYVADTYKARIFVQRPSFGTKRNSAGRRFRFAVFDIGFIRTPHYDNRNVPDAKILWDSHCLRLQKDIESGRRYTRDSLFLTLYPLKATDYEREFLYEGAMYRIVGFADEFSYLDVRLQPAGSTGDEGITVVPLANLRRPLLDDDADIPARNLKAAKDEEADFYEGKDCIKAALARDGVDLMYREMFQYGKRTYALTAITPNAQSLYIFTATCIEDIEEGKAVGEKVMFMYKEVIERIIADRSGRGA